MGWFSYTRQKFIIAAAVLIVAVGYGISRFDTRVPAAVSAPPVASVETPLPDSGAMSGVIGTSTGTSSSLFFGGRGVAPAPAAEIFSDMVQRPTSAAPKESPNSVSLPPNPQPLPSPRAPEPEPRRVDLSSVVGLKCHFSGPDECSGIARGTGVIVNSNGYILTGRHVVDDVWASACYDAKQTSCKLDRCEALRLGEPRQLPLAPQHTYPVNPYPFFDLEFAPNNWDFTTDVVYAPWLKNYSVDEYCALDVAVLEVKAWNGNKPNLSRVLTPAPILASRAPSSGDLLLVPGFAYQELGGPSGSLNESRNLSFDQFRLLTTSYVAGTTSVGDQEFATTTLTLELRSDAPDITGGRSGSPVFWNGYVTGLVQSVDRTDRSVTHAVSMSAIVKALRESNLLPVIETLR
ncbi:MAG: trypsin-like peptidase domain-containing protein [bacterium]|nr:trypsin-like peptidase domain-containing protein [bacterium]